MVYGILLGKGPFLALITKSKDNSCKQVKVLWISVITDQFLLVIHATGMVQNLLWNGGDNLHFIGYFIAPQPWNVVLLQEKN